LTKTDLPLHGKGLTALAQRQYSAHLSAAAYLGVIERPGRFPVHPITALIGSLQAVKLGRHIQLAHVVHDLQFDASQGDTLYVYRPGRSCLFILAALVYPVMLFFYVTLQGNFAVADFK